MPRARLSSILAHVLASTALLACGGKTTEAGDDLFGGSSSGTSSSSGGSQTTTPPPSQPEVPPNPPRPPTPKDAGVDATKPDAGCTAPPELVREGSGCADVFYQPCGYPAGVDPSDGFDQNECAKLCGKNKNGFQYWGCSAYLLDDLPGPSVSCYTCVEGRRPEGFTPRPLDHTIASWLAHAADLERVSIDAFRILARELTHHGAPSALVRAARDAEADEVRHARTLGALAVRAGAELSEDPIAQGPTRDLFTIALENAVEGCVRETYGALVAGWQAEHAQRLDVRRAMKRIHADETAHAELAWNVHAWIRTKLTTDERVLVDAAMDRAFAELADAARSPLPDPWIVDLGLPRPPQARRLVRDLVASLARVARAA